MAQQDVTPVGAGDFLKMAPPTAANFYIWLTSHDINWYVALATLLYVSLQIYVIARDKILPKRKSRKGGSHGS